MEAMVMARPSSEGERGEAEFAEVDGGGAGMLLNRLNELLQEPENL